MRWRDQVDVEINAHIVAQQPEVPAADSEVAALDLASRREPGKTLPSVSDFLQAVRFDSQYDGR